MLVFYNHKQQVDNCQSYSPSAGKPRKVVQAWRQKYSVEMKKVKPLQETSLCLAHSPAYVRGILNCKINNGFDNKSKEIAESLKWTTGSFTSAAVHAWQHKVSTFSPTSGFHHACYDHAAGFCTFSGLTIAGLYLNRNFGVKKIGIIDFDSHAGDGTEDTITKTGTRDIFTHYSLGFNKVNHNNNDQWLEELPEMIKSNFSDCEIIFYQAGMDCHEDDPLVTSGFFNNDQIYKRDYLVFDTCRQMGIPLITNLAGGYQQPFEKVIELHVLTAQAYNDVKTKGGKNGY